MKQEQMNFDINTPKGLANSTTWLNEYLRQIKEGGMWLVPRSGSVYEVRHKEKVAVKLMQTLPDTALDIVFRAAGWKVVDNT